VCSSPCGICWESHVRLEFGLTNNYIYERFGRTSLFATSGELWTRVLMPHIALFALLLPVFEMAVGILLLSRGRYVKIGLAASALFNLFLVQLGLGSPEIQGSDRNFTVNRMPTLLLALLQCPLCWVHFDTNPSSAKARAGALDNSGIANS
jgi:hypothetical protein